MYERPTIVYLHIMYDLYYIDVICNVHLMCVISESDFDCSCNYRRVFQFAM